MSEQHLPAQLLVVIAAIGQGLAQNYLDAGAAE
jgi:hypothetical protein